MDTMAPMTVLRRNGAVRYPQVGWLDLGPQWTLRPTKLSRSGYARGSVAAYSLRTMAMSCSRVGLFG